MECRYANTVAFTRYLIPSLVLLKAEGGMGERRRGNEYPIIKVEAILEKSKNKSIRAQDKTQQGTFGKYQLGAKPKLCFSSKTLSGFLTAPWNKRSLAAADLEATSSLNI